MMYKKKCVNKYEGIFCGEIFLGRIFRGEIHHGWVLRGEILGGGVLLVPSLENQSSTFTIFFAWLLIVNGNVLCFKRFVLKFIKFIL